MIVLISFLFGDKMRRRRSRLTQRLVFDESQDRHVPDGPAQEVDEGVEHPAVLVVTVISRGRLFGSCHDDHGRRNAKDKKSCELRPTGS